MYKTKEYDPDLDLDVPDWLDIRFLIDGKERVSKRIVYEGEDYYAVLSYYPKGWYHWYICEVISKSINWYLDVIGVKDRKKGKGTALLKQIMKDIRQPIGLMTTGTSGAFFWTNGAYMLADQEVEVETNMVLNVGSLNELSDMLRESDDPRRDEYADKMVKANSSTPRTKCKYCGIFSDHGDYCDYDIDEES